MKLIIDIPEDYYKAIKEIPVEQSTADMMIIQNGTPLKQEPCTDAISRQAVLDLPRIKTHNVWGNVIHESVDVEDIRQLPPVTSAKKPNKWIPVSERLPDKNVWVLVTVVQGSGWYIETMRIDKYKGMFTDNIDYYDSVIAWMPLPKPYVPDTNVGDKVESEG